MNIYNSLFESIIDCCDHFGTRFGLSYTAAMVALGAGTSCNLLTLINVLWISGALRDPYGADSDFHPKRYVTALLCGGLLVNSLLARRRLSGEGLYLRVLPTLNAPTAMTGASCIRMAGPVYVLASAALFLLTLALDLLLRPPASP